MTGDSLEAQKESLRPFEDAEAALVRSVVSTAPWLSDAQEGALRYALNLARVGLVRTPDGGDVDLAPVLLPFRDEVLAAVPALTGPDGPDRPAAVRLAGTLGPRAAAFRARAVAVSDGRLSPDALDREVCEKALVVVCGGGGAVAWSYLAAFQLLDQYGLVPRLLGGTSMGAALALFRARRVRWHPEDLAAVQAGLSWRSVFRFLQSDSRYGLPAAMRLYLRAALGEYLKGPDGHPLTLGQLAVPLVVAVTGVRNGALPRDPAYYEHLLDFAGREGRPNLLSRMATEVFGAVGELMLQRDRFARVYLGGDEETRDFDAIDAVGFSSALPGVIHYDVLRDDPRMQQLLDGLFQRHDLTRMCDGGVIDNVPVRTAWRHVQRAGLAGSGSRNIVTLALDCFAPRLTTPLWLPISSIAAPSVARNRPYAHVYKAFSRTLSPLEILPGPRSLESILASAKSELLGELPVLQRLLEPIPALPG